MKAIADRCNIGASLNMMDLSVEAEAFGCKIMFKDDDVPTVRKGIIDDIFDAESIVVPTVGTGRTSVCIKGIRQAKREITDIPVFCGVIGPYSLAGRLFDMTELMMECYDSPDEVAVLLEKVTDFLIAYVKAFKEAGADGVAMAEPAAGLLSPDLADEFSMPYVKKIFDSVNTDDFVIMYHNCGASVGDMMDSVAQLGADIVHLGNAVDIEKALNELPEDIVVMGNIDPAGTLRMGTTERVREETLTLLEKCSKYPNFVLSSGCDIPPMTPWQNIDAFFAAVKEFYEG